MPYIVSGNIKDQTFNNEIVSGKDLAKAFGVEFKDKLVTFRQAGAFQRYDHLNQMQRHAPGFLCNPQFSGTLNGDEVSIRYFKSRNVVPRGKDRVPQEILNPVKVTSFVGSELHLFASEEFDLALYFWLYPKHSKSPLRTLNGEVYYESYSLHEEDEKANERTQNYIDVFLSLRELSKEQLIIKARGINIKGNRIPVVRDPSKETLIRSLSSLAMKFPDEFPNAFRDHITDFNGTIEAAIAVGVIQQGKVNNQDAWLFSDSHGGETIATIRNGRDPKAILKEEINKKFGDLFTKIEKAVFGTLDSVSESDIAAKMAARETTSSQKKAIPEEGTIERSLYDQFDDYKKKGIVVIEKTKVYFEGTQISAVGRDYRMDFVDYLIAHPELVKPI